MSNPAWMLADSTSQYCFVPAKPAEKYFRLLLRATQVASKYFQDYFVLQNSREILPSTSLYYKACRKYFPVRLCTTKRSESTFRYYFVLTELPQSASHYYFVLHGLREILSVLLRATERGVRGDLLQSLQKVVPERLCITKIAESTSQYYFVLSSLQKVFPVRLCTTKLVEHTSQYYFIIPSLQNILPSTTSYYKARRKYLPVFVLQSFHKMRPATTSYYKACAQYFPVLPRTTKLVQGGARGGKRGPELLCITKLPENTCQEHFVLQSLHKTIPSTASYYQACRKYFRDLPSTTVYYKACKSYSNTTLYYEACKKYFPVILCTTKLPRNHHTKHNFSFVLRPNLLRNFSSVFDDWDDWTSFGG